MKTQTEEIEEAVRRGQRIVAMQRGQPIPYPETAENDQRPGNVDDERVIALLRGRGAIPGADIFPPAKLLTNHKSTNSLAHPASSHEAANERAETMLAIGPVCFA